MWNSRAAAARREIAALATAGLGVTDLHAAVADVVNRVVGYDQTCWGCVDPHSMIVSSLISVPDPVPAEYAARFVEAEYSGTEPNTFVDLARRAVPVARMSDLPHREVVASTRLNELFHPLGLEHELHAALCSMPFERAGEPSATTCDRRRHVGTPRVPVHSSVYGGVSWGQRGPTSSWMTR